MIASRIAAEILRLLPRKRLSRLVGQLAALELPQPLLRRAISAYARAYRIDLSEYEAPEQGYRSFDAFFTRSLRKGMRPIDAPANAIVSPADGKVEDCGPIHSQGEFLVKGKTYSLGELLGSDADAARYDGGLFAIVYLSPRDYHRVHAAVSGTVREVRHIDGTLYPVNAIGVRHVPRLFAKNERVAVFQQTSVGEVATVLVGALVVGGITLEFETGLRTNDGTVRGPVRYPKGREPCLVRGQELGAFHFGSTVIVCVPKGAHAELAVEPGTIVRMGQLLARPVALREVGRA